MLTKRIIPCLDVADGKVVKGINFNNLTYAGDPVEQAKKYSEQGADELVFLDITATNDNRDTKTKLVKQVAQQIFVPFTVGGGIRTVDDVVKVLRAGADKIAINSAAVNNPDIISDIANRFGSQCIVVAIDVKKINNSWRVYINAGDKRTGWNALEWASKAEQLGAGEILLTSMDNDGTKIGFDLELYNKITDKLNIPVIASGGAGTLKNILKLFSDTNVDAALAASIFHYGKYSVDDVKTFLYQNGVEVRI